MNPAAPVISIFISCDKVMSWNIRQTGVAFLLFRGSRTRLRTSPGAFSATFVRPFAGFARLLAVARFCPGCCGFPLLPRSFCGLPAFFTRSLRGPLSVARSSRNLLPVACGAWRSPLPGGRITARHLHPRRTCHNTPQPMSFRTIGAAYGKRPRTDIVRMAASSLAMRLLRKARTWGRVLGRTLGRG